MKFSSTKLNQYRMASAVSVCELAKSAGVTSSTIYQVEAGAKPRMSTIRKLAKALERPIEDFLVNENEQSAL